MAEGNGNRDPRLDRIEQSVDQLIADHEQFRVDHRQLLIAQVLQKESIEELLKVTREHTKQIESLGTRVDQMVSSIGEFIRSLPQSLEERIRKLEAYNASQERLL